MLAPNTADSRPNSKPVCPSCPESGTKTHMSRCDKSADTPQQAKDAAIARVSAEVADRLEEYGARRLRGELLGDWQMACPARRTGAARDRAGHVQFIHEDVAPVPAPIRPKRLMAAKTTRKRSPQRIFAGWKSQPSSGLTSPSKVILRSSHPNLACSRFTHHDSLLPTPRQPFGRPRE